MNPGNFAIKAMLLLRGKLNFFLCIFFSVVLLFQGCAVEQSPVKKIQSELQGKKEYAIILNDMREKGNFFLSYYHQYRVDVGEQKTVRPFVEVEKSYYKKNQPYLGMVLTAKTADGTVSTTPFPNGYQYVGNSQYGRWRDNSSGGSMWEFY